MESSTATRRSLDAATVTEAFRITAAERADDVAVRTKGDEVSWTWGELRERVDALAGGLAKLGLGRGDTIAIMLSNRPEFHLVDLAAMTLGATPFSIYQTYSPEQIQYVVSDAGAKIVVAEQALLKNVVEARKDLPEVEHLILVDGEAADGALALADVEGSNPDFDVDAAAEALEPDDMLTLIYTSGTTGPPKGVQLTHKNLMALVGSLEELLPLGGGANIVSWLPAAHIAERGAHHYLPVVHGGTINCCDDPRNVLEYVKEVHPNWFFAVPRIWEKLKAGLETMVGSLPDEQRIPTQKAIEAATQKVRLEQKGEPVPEELAAACAQAEEKIFSNLRLMLGFDKVEAVNVGAAPTPVEVLEFFHAVGIPVSEVWGMSETCGVATANPPGKIKLGTVGPPVPGVEIRLAEDGEVHVRGDSIMPGYRNLPDKTKETFSDDGWLLTGDIGEIDEDGYLKIVDRKKELIINAAGKNMSPANIEATLKSSSELIGQAAVIGDARSFNTALIVLDVDTAPAWAAKNGLEGKSLDELATEDSVREALQAGVDKANERLARVEQIKKFHIVSGDWEPGGDELTPTMKLKRKPIAEKYSDEIEAMYAK